MNKKLAVIFDMDGVLLDTARFNSLSFDELLQPKGLNMDILADKYGEGFRGTSLVKMLGVIKEDHGIEFDVQDFSKQAGEIAFELMDKENITGDPHLELLLKELKNAGILVGIGTSSLRWRVEPILNRLGIRDYFEVIVTAEDVPEHKPNPHVFLEVARQLDIEPGNCIVIEDARSGIEAAHNGNMKAVAFTAYNSEPKLIEEADMSVKDFSELSVENIKDLIG